MTPRDKRHVGELEQNFTQHFRIQKFTIETKPWILLLHLRMAGWRWLGNYESHQEAIEAMNDQFC